jgi:serine/threonine protein kinase
MGTVYLAEQLRPVRRQVALKLIKPGMDSRHVLARFESERQALALMEHPNIARVLDAGTGPDGHPFFVMELVKGIPITEYCDNHRLDLNARLTLFRQVCSAVQHAHQKGIIHRDLKPSNILIESHDDKPVPKVIDFGLAKATSGMRLSEQSLFTAFGSVAGTPLYMAPEQASFNALDVDTRADIYALGVILYELLTGTTPIARESIQRAALDEMLRVIREVEPPAPSSRISTSEELPSLAASLQVEPARLSRLVRGELDWIVMKALAKERERRYASAIALADDIDHHLNHVPVSAGPPTAGYRLGKSCGATVST